MATYTEEITLTTVTCITCGVIHGIPEVLYDSLHRLGGYYFCPSGHQQGWNEGTDKKKRKKVERELQIERQKHDQTSAELRNSEKKRKRTETRIANGVCPCCNRSFKNVRRHMKKKHADFAA